MANRRFTQFYGSLHNKPVQLDCNFIVDPTNGNGLGTRSLKGPGIANVFMNTTNTFLGTTASSTLITGIASGTAGFSIGGRITGGGIPFGAVIQSILSPSSITISLPATTTVVNDVLTFIDPGNPNPAAGLIYVNFQDNYNRYYFGTAGFVSPLSGILILVTAGLTIGNPYTIVSVGTTTTAQWNTLGVPRGTIPAPGVSFIAITAAAGVGTGAVEVSTSSGIMGIEVIGDPNTTITSLTASILGKQSGSYMILQALDAAGALTAPAAGSTIGLSFFMSNTKITNNGE